MDLYTPARGVMMALCAFAVSTPATASAQDAPFQAEQQAQCLFCESEFECADMSGSSGDPGSGSGGSNCCTAEHELCDSCMVFGEGCFWPEDGGQAFWLSIATGDGLDAGRASVRLSEYHTASIGCWYDATPPRATNISVEIEGSS